MLRLVDSIHRDKDIDKEIIFDALEDALQSAARKYYGPKADIAVFVDRETGVIEAFDGNEPVDAIDIGRIAAQTAKQVIIQKIRDAEQDALFRDYEGRVKQIVSGTVQRREGSAIIVNLGRTEGILPRSEQVPEEDYRIGDRIRCYLQEVRRVGSRVRILLSRSNPDFIRRLFELEVPEIAERVIEIMAIAREPGYRTKVAVASADSKVDCVGACVGVRGSRIKNIVAELNDEKIDIVRWSDSRDVLIANALKPAEVRDVTVIGELNRARVIVPEEELSLAIGKRGRNVRLAAKLCDVDIDVLSEAEAERELEELVAGFGEVEDVPERFPQRLFQMGYAIEDIAEGAAGWVERFAIEEEKAEEVYAIARQAAEQIAAERAAAEAAAQAEAEAAALAEAEAEAAAQLEGEPAETLGEEAAAPLDEGAAVEQPAEPLEAAAEGPAEPVAEPPTEEAPAEEAPAEEPLAEEPLAEEPLAEEPLAEEPPAEEAPAEEALAEEPLAEEPLAEEAPAEEAPAEEPPAEEPPAEEPPAEQPLAEAVAAEQEAAEAEAAAPEAEAVPAPEGEGEPGPERGDSSEGEAAPEAAPGPAPAGEEDEPTNP